MWQGISVIDWQPAYILMPVFPRPLRKCSDSANCATLACNGYWRGQVADENVNLHNAIGTRNAAHLMPTRLGNFWVPPHLHDMDFQVHGGMAGDVLKMQVVNHSEEGVSDIANGGFHHWTGDGQRVVRADVQPGECVF